MVFSSVPLYLDPPNWQQQQLSGVNQGNDNLHLIHPTSVPNPPPTHMGGGPGSGPQIRPNSMAERARLAKIPPPEAPLKCPRCDSTNTKFCYFNNYNLSQPRHFCKTCRRYWTRGGALRNVPVGGGCRRNKRSSSKTSLSGGGTAPLSTSEKPSAAAIGGGMDVGGPTGLLPGIGNGGMTSFMASLHNMAQLGMGNLGLTFGGALQAPPLGGGDHHNPQLDFNVSSLLNQHRHAPQMHFPGALSGAFELPPAPVRAGAGGNPNLYSSTSSFQNDVVVNDNNLPKSTTSLSELAPIKMEGQGQVQGQRQGQGLNLDKQLMMGINNNSSSTTSITDNNNQVWGNGMVGNNTIGASTNMWTNLSGLNSSSTSHLM